MYLVQEHIDMHGEYTEKHTLTHSDQSKQSVEAE